MPYNQRRVRATQLAYDLFCDVGQIPKPNCQLFSGQLASFVWCARRLFFFLGILSRSEPVLDSMQPEEQHGFRRGCWLEEHLVTACPFGWSALICPKHSKPYWQQKAGVQGDAGHGARVCVKPKVFARCFCNGPCENGEQIWRL